jgi:GDP-D-mannose dehydratase
LGWEPSVSFRELVHMMVDADLKSLQAGNHMPNMSHI